MEVQRSSTQKNQLAGGEVGGWEGVSERCGGDKARAVGWRLGWPAGDGRGDKSRRTQEDLAHAVRVGERAKLNELRHDLRVHDHLPAAKERGA